MSVACSKSIHGLRTFVGTLWLPMWTQCTVEYTVFELTNLFWTCSTLGGIPQTGTTEPVFTHRMPSSHPTNSVRIYGRKLQASTRDNQLVDSSFVDSPTECIIIRPHHSTMWMSPIFTDRVTWSVCRSVWQSWAMVEPIKLPFGLWIQDGPRNPGIKWRSRYPPINGHF